MKVMWREVEFSELLVRDFNAGWIIPGIEFRFNSQSGACGRIR